MFELSSRATTSFRDISSPPWATVARILPHSSALTCLPADAGTDSWAVASCVTLAVNSRVVSYLSYSSLWAISELLCLSCLATEGHLTDSVHLAFPLECIIMTALCSASSAITSDISNTLHYRLLTRATMTALVPSTASSLRARTAYAPPRTLPGHYARDCLERSRASFIFARLFSVPGRAHTSLVYVCLVPLAARALDSTATFAPRRHDTAKFSTPLNGPRTRAFRGHFVGRWKNTLGCDAFTLAGMPFHGPLARPPGS